jgi:AraC-like DNA-binding protein
MEAYFSGIGFAPHRHDTYAIAMTLSGIQSFSYRGASRYSEPGHCVILHPNEVHDGQAGTDLGFRYRVAYIEPVKIQSVLGGRALPFLENGVSSDAMLYEAVLRLLGEYGHALNELEYEDAVYDIALALERLGQTSSVSLTRIKRFDYKAAEIARQFICDHQSQSISLDCLEHITGRDRYRLSRDFRALFGTSPYRYLLMRRLESAREMMLRGHSQTDIAIACDFADQSHMIRHF